MRKKYLPLTEDQRKRNVIFSSQLMPSDDPTIHEVLRTDDDKNATMERLMNDKFFNNSPYKYNLIRK